VNRQEAIGVVSEVLNGCKCFIDVTHISITDSSAQHRMKSTGYEIYIKCFPNDDLRECLAPILAKHQLKMAELTQAIIIYKPKPD
jgi:hypothetical protein